MAQETRIVHVTPFGTKNETRLVQFDISAAQSAMGFVPQSDDDEQVERDQALIAAAVRGTYAALGITDVLDAEVTARRLAHDTEIVANDVDTAAATDRISALEARIQENSDASDLVRATLARLEGSLTAYGV